MVIFNSKKKKASKGKRKKKKTARAGGKCLLKDTSYKSSSSRRLRAFASGIKCTFVKKVSANGCNCWMLREDKDSGNVYYVSVKTLRSPKTSPQNFKATIL